MSTRSMVGMVGTDGQIVAVYVHNDGYPAWVGAICKRHYTTTAKVERLVRLGHLSLLGSEIGKRHSFDKRHTYPVHPDEVDKTAWCLAYGRDRGEKGQHAETYANLSQFAVGCDGFDAEYAYLWDGIAWTGYQVTSRGLVEVQIPDADPFDPAYRIDWDQIAQQHARIEEGA